MRTARLRRRIALGSIAGAAFTLSVASAQTTTSWINSAGGDWNDPLNWSSGQTPGVSDRVEFSNASAAGYQVNIATDVAAYGLSAGDDSVTFALHGSTLSLSSPLLWPDAALILGQNTSKSHLTFTGGSLRLSGNNAFAVLARDVGSEATLDLNDTCLTYTHLFIGGGGTATINLNDGGLASALGTFKVQHGATINYNSGTFNVGSLDMQGGQVLISRGGTDKVVHAFALFGNGPFSGKIDLNDHGMILDWRDTRQTDILRQMLVPAYASGTWKGNGLTSSLAAEDHSKAIGFARAGQVGITSFEGQSVGSTSLVVTCTYYGDANLDGRVDVADLGALATNWQRYRDWSAGDFNYDGFVDVTDLGLLATDWQAGVNDPLGPSLPDALRSLGLPPVPEPATMTVLLGIGLAVATCRRCHPGQNRPKQKSAKAGV